MNLAWINNLGKVMLVGGLLCLAQSCGPDAAEEVAPDDTQTLTDNGLADMLLLDGVQLTDDAFDGNLNGIAQGRTEGCGTVNINWQTGTIAINFGSGCTGDDGRTRSGSISVSFRGGRFHEENAQIAVTFANYTVDGYIMNGVVNIGNFKLQPNRTSYRLTTTDFRLGFPNNGGQVTFSGQRDIEANWARSLRLNDNEWRIRGNTTGINRLGQTFAYNITEPNIVLGSCLAQRNPYPVRGKVNCRVNNRPEGQLDWGNGPCDRQATIRFGEVVRVIDLP
jgi:hypothetical protein